MPPNQYIGLYTVPRNKNSPKFNVSVLLRCTRIDHRGVSHIVSLTQSPLLDVRAGKPSLLHQTKPTLFLTPNHTLRSRTRAKPVFHHEVSSAGRFQARAGMILSLLDST